MLRAFISHSSKDKPFVRKLKEDLQFNEIETWVDEDELKPGDKLYDTLILGLQNSTHFLIVLTNNIKNSYWIDTEINEAISSLDKNIIQKIIPILLRKTEIPVSLEGLLYADFSGITFSLTSDGKVSFSGEKYNAELEKIVTALKQTKEYNLTPTETSKIVEKTEAKSVEISKNFKTSGLYEIVGFATTASRIAYITNLQKQFKATPLAKIPAQSVIPIILPNLLKPLFSKISLGDKIFFPDDNGTLFAHFCGFSTNNTRIILGAEIRKEFKITRKEILNVSIDGKTKEIIFYDV